MGGPSEEEREDELSREDLRNVLDAVRAFSREVGAPDYEHVIELVLRRIVETLDVDAADVYLVDDAGRSLVFGGGYPDGGATGGKFPRIDIDGFTARPAAYAVADVGGEAAKPLAEAGFRQIGWVPLQVGGRPYGVFHLGRKEDRSLTDRELKMTQLFADLVAVYVDNARLFTDARRRLDETRLMLEVARAAATSLELDELLDASAKVVPRLVDASNAFVLLLDEGGANLRGVACSDPRWLLETRRISIPRGSASIAWRSVLSRTPVAVPNAAASAEVHQGLVALFGEKSLLALPLLLQAEPIGVVVVDDTRAVRHWSAAEIERTELVVLQIAGAIGNAKLYDQVRRGYDELARAQAELVKRERLAALGQLAATLAHEVRNPLGVLFNSIGTLGKTLPQAGDARILLGIMSEEVQRLERLVRELLDFVRPLSPTLESESLRAVTAGAIDAARAELGAHAARMRNDVPTSLPPVRIDARMMRRALLNLLVNGAQAAGATGLIAVRAHATEHGEKRLVAVEIADDGPGIPAEVAPRIFDPFFTTKATGTGLGLAVVKGIVDAHGGDISVLSKPGDGATIVLHLPLADDAG